jgi:hypothetical protein
MKALFCILFITALFFLRPLSSCNNNVDSAKPTDTIGVEKVDTVKVDTLHVEDVKLK